MIEQFGPTAESLISKARDALRTAQVEIYCDHDAQALKAVRVARKAIEDSPHVGNLIHLVIDEAAWHLRHHQSHQALQALDWARNRLLT